MLSLTRRVTVARDADLLPVEIMVFFAFFTMNASRIIPAIYTAATVACALEEIFVELTSVRVSIAETP